MQKENISLFFKGGSSEDYLTTVYEVCKETGGSAQQVEIAARMDFSKPSVVGGLRVLAQKGFVTIVSGVNSKYVYLTDEGRALAEKLLGRRRVVAAFLESLGLSEADAAEEAHLWEHGVSDETTEAMEKALTRAKTPDVSEPLSAASATRQNAYRRHEERRFAQTAAVRM